MPLLLALPLAFAGNDPDFRPDLGDHRFDAEDGCFSSGLRMVVAEDRREPVVTVTLVVDGGSAADPLDEEGTAQLLHRVSARARTPSGASVRERLDVLGAVMNSEAHLDATSFVTLAPVASLAGLFAIEGQRLVDPLAGVTEADVEAERVRAVQDLRSRQLERLGAIWAPLFATLYPEGHPYHRARSASATSFVAVTLEDLRAAARRWYRPSSATLYVTGAVDAAAARATALRVLPDAVAGVPEGTPRIPCASRVPESPPEPPAPATREVTRVVSELSTHVKVVGWSSPAAWGADDILGELAVEGLSSGFGARSCRRIRGHHASTTWCLEVLREEPASDWVPSESGVGSVGVLADRFFFAGASGSLVRHLVEAAERAGHPEAVEGPDAALATHFGDEPVLTGALVDALGRVTPQDIGAYAARWFTPERAAVVLVRPALDPADVALPAQPRPWPARADVAGVELAAHLSRPDLAAARIVDLPNGLRAVVLPYGDLPLVSVGLDFRGGTLHETTPGISELLATMEVFEPRNIGFNVNHATASAGASRRIETDGLAHQHRMVAPAGNLDDVLYLLRVWLDGTELEWQRRGDFVEKRARELHGLRGSPHWWARALSVDRLFPGHPLSRGWLDDQRLLAVRATTDAQVAAWRDRVRHPSNGTLYVVGKVDPAQAEAAIRARLGAWKGRGKTPAPLPLLPPPPAPPARQVILLDTRERAFSVARVSCQVDGAAAPEALDLLERVVRERHVEGWRGPGWSHDAGVGLTRWEGGAATLVLQGALGHEVVGEALLATRALLAELAALPAPHPDIRRHAFARAREDVLSRLTVAGTLEWLATAWRAGWPESVSAMPARLAAVTGADVARALAPCVGHEVIVVSGPVATLEDQAARLGAPVEVYDWRTERESRWRALDPDAWEKAR